MTTTTSLTEAEVHAFVDDWYRALDVHVPLEDFLAMVADTGIEFRFPEVTVTDKAGLTEWYNRVTNTFFDEVHETKELAITTAGDQAEVKILTLWQASVWNPPAPKSERIAFHARQTWKVTRSPTTSKPVVLTYIVDSFEPVGGTGALPVKDV
jgi:hypothetical protein